MAVVGDGVNDLPTIVVKSPEARRAELRRMRTIATSLLVVMTLIFIATRFAPPNWFWAPYLGAFAEAGMVGACADWFAVVALFRRPARPADPAHRHCAGEQAPHRRLARPLRHQQFPVAAGGGGAAARDRHRRPRRPGARRPAQRRGDHRHCRPACAACDRRIAAGRGRRLDRRRRPDAAPRRCRPRRSPRGRCPSCGRRGRGRACSIRASASSRARSPATEEAIFEQVRRQSSPWIPKWVDEIIASRLLHGMAGTLEDDAAAGPSVAGPRSQRG